MRTSCRTDNRLEVVLADLQVSDRSKKRVFAKTKENGQHECNEKGEKIGPEKHKNSENWKELQVRFTTTPRRDKVRWCGEISDEKFESRSRRFYFFRCQPEVELT